MKIAVIGFWAHDHCEHYFSQALRELGVDVIPFKLSQYFKGRYGEVQNALPIPLKIMKKINSDLLNKFSEKEVENLFFWNCNHIFSSTMKEFKSRDKQIITYNNDDPFGSVFNNKKPYIQFFQYFWYLRNLKYADINFVYRPVNINEVKAYSSKECKVALLKPYFIPQLHKPKHIMAEDCENDVIFIGHYEQDQRLEMLEYLFENNIRVSLYGTGWNKIMNSDFIKSNGKTTPLRGDEYSEALNSSKICLSFLSKMNRDVYTRRCFEIPGMSKLLLCERTKDMQLIFNEDKEAVYFSDKFELLEKVQWLLKHPEEIDTIAKAGYEKSYKNGDDIKSRARYFLEIIKGQT